MPMTDVCYNILLLMCRLNLINLTFLLFHSETPTPSTYRLPTSVIPHHYNVEIKPNIYGSDPTAFNFEGSVQIEVEITEKTQNITLLKWESLTIDESSLRVTRKRKLLIACWIRQDFRMLQH